MTDIQTMVGVFRFRRAKGFDAVGDHFHSGDGCAAGSKRAEDQKEREIFKVTSRRTGKREHRDPVGERSKRPDQHHQSQSPDREICRDREEFPGFPGAPEIHDHDEHDRDESQSLPMRKQLRNGRSNRCDSGRHAHSHREDIIDHERRGSDQRRHLAKIRPGHDIGSPAFRIFVNDLAIRNGQDNDEKQNGEADGDGPCQRRGAGKD
jgi:hypothetical protein